MPTEESRMRRSKRYSSTPFDLVKRTVPMGQGREPRTPRSEKHLRTRAKMECRGETLPRKLWCDVQPASKPQDSGGRIWIDQGLPSDDLRHITEGFYDTASLRSQQASQHRPVYQKEITLPKRRCPRCCQPSRDNGANDSANPRMLQRRSRGLA